MQKYFQIYMYSFNNLAYWSSRQPIVAYNFSEIEYTFPVLLLDYVADCW